MQTTRSPVATIQGRYSIGLIVFILIATILTIFSIQTWIAPTLKKEGEERLKLSLNEVGRDITFALREVKAQQRAITQLIPTLTSAQIDTQLPHLIDQYGNPLVFGGGIWPLPNKRLAGVDRASTFYHRDESGQLVENTYWNSDEAPNYYTQPWHRAGQNAPQGECVWANAYKDGASAQPRTNCAMGIYQQGDLYGVATIDVTLGFFNQLVAEKQKALDAKIAIVESDGKILSQSRGGFTRDDVLKSVSGFNTPFAKAIETALNQQTQRVTFQGKSQEQTLLLSPVPGTPWTLVVAKPTSALTALSDKMLTTLAWIQLPLIGLLLVIMLIAFKRLHSRFETFKHNVDSLSSGDADLTLRLPIKGNDELDNISHSVNDFIAYLQDLVQKVMSANQTCSNYVEQIAHDASQTLSTLEAHVRETEGVATAINQLSASASDVAENVNQSHDVTRQMQSEAQQAREETQASTRSVIALVDNVETSEEKVAQMREHATAIESILGVIGDIAEQTNLLALNAAIEAARAGEQGRGFAVVADEVRNLASRTQQSTGEVDKMLAQVSEAVTQASQSMQNTREQCVSSSERSQQVEQRIDTMTQSVTQVDELSTQIATAATEQSQVTEDISQTMTSIRDIVAKLHQHGQTTEQRAHDLQAANTALQQLVGQFKV
ncbi:methyl-accepting chemotaxis protein [Salinivibrio kushneri]|uniref:Methyl-accepting chemotaxis protein n=1 Tax=Salinivibrio kushneri TaxID=1908198 RepID=A0AB36JYK6_9GAMM|nr:methyl-accepting chemotaxis protein [Salinivibrio kushneri]OOE39831.1 methyl-accepting chemotaxis protein [Salinivibrio kushneri]QCP03415.1 methyl-accepting chemotaxis protein [Salinivibrio kushneri]